MVDPAQEKGNRKQDRGYAQLDRRLSEMEVFHNAFCWQVYTWCVMCARFKANTDLDVGQFRTSLRQASHALHMSQPTIIKWLRWLEDRDYIEISADSQNGRKIKVLKLFEHRTSVPLKEIEHSAKPSLAPGAKADLADTVYKKNDKKNEKNGELYDGRLTKTKHEFPSRRRAAS